MKSDEELMAEYRAGSNAAFEEIFARFAPLLLRIMRRRVRNEEDASELVQQTFLQLHRARADFEEGRRLRPWLMTIAFNLQRELFRRRQRRPEAALETEPTAPQSERAPMEKAAQAERLRQAVAKLPDGQREAIELHWFEEQSFAEVALVLGVTVNAVKVRAHRGYKALRALLEEVSDDDRAA
jgi:RNA polymerase sigma-70 factor (ECF subfamily)